MIRILKSSEVPSNEIFARVENAVNVEQVVADIIANVRKNGDAAIFDYTKRFDGAEIDASNIRVTEEEILEAYELIDQELLDVILTQNTKR